MKKIFYTLLALTLIFSGCNNNNTNTSANNSVSVNEPQNSGEKPNVEENKVSTVFPRLISKNADFEDMDIAPYKKYWDTVEVLDTCLDRSTKNYEPINVDSNYEFTFGFSENPPKDVKVTEYYIRDREVIVSFDKEVLSSELSSTYENNEVKFSISRSNYSDARVETRLIVLDCSWGDTKDSNLGEYSFLAEVSDPTVTSSNHQSSTNIYEYTEFDGVNMSIEPIEVNPYGTLIDIENKTGKKVSFSSYYRIEELKDGEWLIVNYDKSVSVVSWDAVAYEIKDSLRLPVVWDKLYGNLPSGEYRIIRNFYVDDDTTKVYNASATFTIQ